MRLLFDFGNSRLKWALSDRGIQQSGSLDEQELSSLADNLDKAMNSIDAPDEAWISSVAGDIATDKLKDWLRERWSLEGRAITANSEVHDVVNSYVQPESLGSDRWAALVAVRHRYTQPASIIDCGTAVTIDFISDNRFYGGVILPGLQLSRNSLITSTAKLHFKDSQPISSISTSTSAGILSGTLLGLVGAIEHIVKQQQQNTGLPPRIYLTGGNANAIQPYLALANEVIDDLVLQGIEVIAELEA